MPSVELVTVSRWGLLPFAIVLGVVLAGRLGALAFPSSTPGERAVFGATLASAVVAAGVRAIGAAPGGLSEGVLFGALFVATGALFLARRDRRMNLPWRGLVTLETAPVALVGAGAVAIACAAAYLLPVWQWDALGYHLPYVDFALQAGSFAGVPKDLPYISTYPHVVENVFVAWRAMLPDDRLVDAAQIPFALLGAAAVALLARGFGARREHAVAAGLLWLTLPALFLQLPTDYVDVASAALLLAAITLVFAEPTPPHVIAAGVALGLFLGSKPNAPVGAAILFAVLAARAWRARVLWPLAVAAACALAIGAESFVVNLVRHGNPIWPVRVTLGPLTLPGDLPMRALLESGCAAPRVHGPLPLRLVKSWTSFDAPPVFDMRYGGFGLVFLAALPVAIVAAVRRRSLALAAALAAALASPDPAVPRYVFAFPGLVFALAAPALSRAPAWGRRAALALAAVAAAWGLARAYPGLAGEGPPLGAYVAMSEPERLRAVGADGPPGRFYDALDRLRPGDVTAYDSSLELSYLAWPPDLSSRAERIPDGATDADASRVVGDPRVKLLVVGEGSPVDRAAREDGAFEQVFRCRTQPLPACAAGPADMPPDERRRALEILNQRWPSCVALARR